LVLGQSNDKTFRHSYMAKRDGPAGPSSPWIRPSSPLLCILSPKSWWSFTKADS
jgi:hypothetical protein